MAGELENVLSRLLVPDNNVIQQATQELKQLTKDPSLTPALCTVLGTSTNPQVRQYAAVLLRRRIMKKKQWKSLPEEVRTSIRQNVLQLLLQEPEKSVRKAVCEIVGTVAKHDLGKGGWPELFQFFEQYTRSEDPQQREAGMYVLNVTSSTATEQLKPHLQSILNLCAVTLEDKQNPQVPFNTIQTLTNLVVLIGTDEVKAMQSLIPHLLSVIRAFIALDEDQAVEALEILDELVECEVAVLVPHIKSTIEFCLEIGADKRLSDSLRIKALSFVSNLTRLKRKTILKLKLAGPILAILFPILCEIPEEDEDEENFEEAEAQRASSYAGQKTVGKIISEVIDTLSLNLPPEKFIPQLMALVEPALTSEDPCMRKAALVAMAVSAEGCADHIRSKYLNVLLQTVCNGIRDPNPNVCNAALFALGQFSEHLQPDISKFSGEVLPLLFDYLAKATDSTKNHYSLTKTYYALETFCENLGKDILPYLSSLLPHLLTILSSPTASIRHKELAISAIGAVANAACEGLVPYFPQIIEHLKAYLANSQSEDALKLQIQAIDTLGVLARTIGAEHFLPLAVECVQLGLTLLREATDPDLKRCIYGLFAALSTLLKAEMGVKLEEMVKEMLASIKSTEGIQTHVSEATDMFKFFDEEPDVENGEEDLESMEDEEEADDIQGYSIGNAYLDEKEDACNALGEIAKNCGVAFMPYLEETFKTINDNVNHPGTNVRTGAVSGLGDLCVAVAKVVEKTNSEEAKTALKSMLSSTVPVLLKTIQEDEERDVAMVTVETLEDMIKEIKAPLLEASGDSKTTLEEIILCIRNVIQEKTACQDDSEQDAEIEDEAAEYDNALIQNTGDLIPTIAKVVGGDTFAPYFAGLMPDLMKKLKKTSSESDKSFAVGTMAETLLALGPTCSAFAQTLYPVFQTMMKDDDEEVRSNATFGMGVLAANSGEVLHSHYKQIVKEMFDMLNRETDKRVIDNICAACCRMIWMQAAALPVDQMIPVLIKCLPLKEDFEENTTVYTCIAQLYKTSPQTIIPQLGNLVAAISEVLGSSQIEPEMQMLLEQMIQDLAMNFPAELQVAAGALPPENAHKLQAASTNK